MSSPIPQPASAGASGAASFQEQLAFERMLAEIAARFASVPPEAVQAEIAEGMERLGGVFNAALTAK